MANAWAFATSFGRTVMPTLQDNPPVTLTANDLLVFTHIPKTAGMTFKKLLDRHFPAAQRPKIGPDYQASVDRIKALPDEARAQIRCLSGHLPYGVHKFFPQRRMQYVAFVRDPVGRALSEYFFFAKQPQLMPLIGLEVGANLTPQAFLEYQASVGMMDFQTRVLCGYDNMIESMLPPYPEMKVDDVDAFIDKIVDSYAMIGTVERFDESLLLIKEKFNWRNVCYISRNIGTPSKKKAELKAALTDEVSKLNPLDCKLYDRIKKLVDDKIEARGPQFQEELNRFHAKNSRYSKLWRIYRATGLRRLKRVVTRR